MRIGGSAKGAVAAVIGLLAVCVAPAQEAGAIPVRSRQWYLDSLKVTEVQRISTGKGVTVAVLDSGVQADHPDLAGQVLKGADFASGDTDGRVDRKNHGTGVAGLIAAVGGGPDHALGLAPGVKILPARLNIDMGGAGLDKAIRWAVDQGAKVINMSVGTDGYGQTLKDAVRYAIDHDVVLVAAAGNAADGTDGVVAPAEIPGVIAVSAADRAGVFWTGGVRGPQMVLSAPGVDMMLLSNQVPSPQHSGYAQTQGGTSAATPLVAASAALIRSKYPQLKAPDVINRLIRTADDAGPPGRDDEYGFGRLNVLRALTADVPPVSGNPLLPAPSQAAAPGGSPSGGLGLGTALAIGGGVLAVLLLILGLVLWLTRSNRRVTGPTR